MATHSHPFSADSPYAPNYTEKDVVKDDYEAQRGSPEFAGVAVGENYELQKSLKSRHMQMIAIGGAIGAGFFVGSGSALATGGPGSLTIGFIIIGIMILFTMHALGELAVLYPVNGAFYQYICRFIDPSWGFACAWDYALSWLIILPFEITAAGITISFWHTYNIGIWIAVFLVLLTLVQFFGVRGYGEVEFVLSIIKVLACVGFIIFAVIDVCGGVPSDPRGYIGARYWHNPGAFNNGFHGFCTVFVTAAFAFAGTELTGLAAAEAADPRKSIPQATKQVFWRIAFFYVVGLFLLGLLVPSDNENLLNSSGANTKYSPFVIAFQLAGVKGLPSVINAVITISVISVANSATYGSTRTFQALASQGMAPKILAKVDKKGRPVPTVILQLCFGLLAFINEAKVGSQVFNWLLALSGLANLFVWGSICLAHIRFRQAWKKQGHSLDELPYKAPFGIWGSAIGLTLNIVALIAQFYVAVWPVGGSPDAIAFFSSYLALPVTIVLYLFWKIYSATSKDPRINSRGWKPFLRTWEMDLTTGLRSNLMDLAPLPGEERRGSVVKSVPKKIFHAFF